MKFALSSILFVCLAATAHDNKKHRHHEAHSHGHGELAIAFDGLVGQVEFKTPANDIVGFEHQAKSEKDKAKVAAATNEFATKIATYIQFKSDLGCQFEKKSIEMVADADESNHSDFVARFTVTCTKAINGSNVVFDFTSQKRIKNIEATVLVGDLQLKAEIKSKKTTLEIK